MIFSLAIQETCRGDTARNPNSDANLWCQCVLETLQYAGHTSLVRLHT